MPSFGCRYCGGPIDDCCCDDVYAMGRKEEKRDWTKVKELALRIIQLDNEADAEYDCHKVRKKEERIVKIAVQLAKIIDRAP